MDFAGVCAYCEGLPEEATVDHFRPQSRFPHLTLDWLNLVHSCRRCNQAKGSGWPGYDDAATNRWLTAEDSRYVGVSEYVTPNACDSRRPASEYFDYDVDTGEMKPSARLDPPDWSLARRTIRDIDLNDSGRSENDPGHLWNLRLDLRDQLILRLNEMQDPDLKAGVLVEFMSPGRPFSSFVTAYVSALSGGLMPP